LIPEVSNGGKREVVEVRTGVNNSVRLKNKGRLISQLVKRAKKPSRWKEKGKSYIYMEGQAGTPRI